MRESGLVLLFVSSALLQSAEQSESSFSGDGSVSAVEDALHPDSASEQRDHWQEKNANLIAHAWLEWQCKMVSSVYEGVVFSVTANALADPTGLWPNKNINVQPYLTLARQALLSGGYVFGSARMKTDVGDHSVSTCLVALSIHNENGRYIVVLNMAERNQSQREAVVQLLQWAGLWLGSLDDIVSQSQATYFEFAAQLGNRAIESLELQSAAIELVHHVCNEFSCDRVSLGLLQSGILHIQAISQNVKFDEKMQLVRALEAAMEEAIEQRSMINSSSSDVNVITRAQSELQRLQGSMSVCTLPLYSNNKVIGAVVLEREQERPFSAQTTDRCNRLLLSVGSVLQLLQISQRSVMRRFFDQIKTSAKTLFFPKNNKNKLITAASILALSLLMLVPVTYHVKAQASIEGADKQVIAAPHAGFIKAAFARAGDIVKEGQIIASLDDQDLQIEQIKWQSEIGKIDTSMAKAMTERDQPMIGMLQARRSQVEAELALVKNKLNKSALYAPFDGVIVSGDVNQSLGAPVEAGQVLFELASLNEYRLLLDIDEHDVALVSMGQVGSLRFNALPSENHVIKMQSILPVAISKEGRSFFNVEAILQGSHTMLHPGMQGIAKIAIGERTLFWAWTHKLREQLSLWFWTLGW